MKDSAGARQAALAFGPAIAPWIINHIQEEVLEGVLVTVFAVRLGNGYNLLRGRRHLCCCIRCQRCLLLLRLLHSPKEWLVLLLWLLLTGPKQRQLVVLLRLLLLESAKHAWLALLLTKPVTHASQTGQSSMTAAAAGWMHASFGETAQWCTQQAFIAFVYMQCCSCDATFLAARVQAVLL